MGGLAGQDRLTWSMMLIGTLSLTGVGIPHLVGFAGFHSKDAIIEAAYAAHTPGNYAFWLLVVAAFMTVVLLLAADLPDVPRHARARITRPTTMRTKARR